MIPRQAFFYWTGPAPFSWLREQSLITFRRHHPDWDIYLGSPECPNRILPAGAQWVRDDITDPNLPPAARSDWWRWHILAERGGLYADTDVLFARNIEPLFSGNYDAWITMDGGTECPGLPAVRLKGKNGKKRRPGGLSIGVLGGQKGSEFFKRAALFAALFSGPDPCGDYQSLGTSMLVRIWDLLTEKVNIGPIPFSAFYRGSSAAEIAPLWRPGHLRPEEYGIHYYGGPHSIESAPYLKVTSVEQLPDCVVRSVLAQS